MKIKNKWKLGLLFLGALVLTGCTKSFVTVQDKANMMIIYQNQEVSEGKTNLDQIVENVNKTGSYFSPSEQFFDYIEENVAETVHTMYATATLKVNDVEKQYSDYTLDELLQEGATRDAFVLSNEYALTKYAKEKATTLESMWSNYDIWTKEALNEGLTLEDVGSTYYHTYMKTQFNNYAGTITACITPVDGEYDGLRLEGKTWGEAFSYGFIEGLLVWPISAMLYYFTVAFSALGTFGTVLSILVVTVIVRGLLLLLTFKQTASQSRMQLIQPEIEKLQQKYPNSNTNQYEKQMMAQEQMNLYKKYYINPFGMLIVMLFQFPIFIAVWGAMSGSAVLRTGDLWGLQLSAATGASITNWSGTPSVVALIIYIIMALAQAVSMLLPQYLQKRRTKNVQKLGKSNAKENSMNQMKIMNIVMLVMIIFMGFSLPVAMAIYWTISALISLTQSLVMSAINNKKSDKKDFVKYKTKK